MVFQYLKRGYKKEEDRLSSKVCDKTRGSGFKLEERRFRSDVRKKVSYSKRGEALAQAAQRGGGCPIPGRSRSGWMWL